MEDSIGAILADVSRLMRRSFDERARGIGVTRPQWQVLLTLRRREGSNQGTLADMLDIEPITLCRILDRLEDAQLIERRRDPADRRAWQLFLTDAARARLEELQPLGVQVMELALDGLDATERESPRRVLDQIRRNLARSSDTHATAGHRAAQPSTPEET